MGLRGASKVDQKNIIQRATDYFGVAYYGFLALYSLYELFFGGEFVSILVVGPIIYTFVIYGMLHLLLVPFYALGKLLTKEKGIWEQMNTSLAMGFWFFVLVLCIGDIYLNPTELNSLFEPSSLTLMLIVVIEIMLRLLFSQRSENNRRMNIVERIKRLDEIYPIGPITFVGFFMGLLILGFLYMPTDRQDGKSILFFCTIMFVFFWLLFEWVNRKLGVWHLRKEDPERALAIENKKEWLLFQKPIVHLCSPWISLLAAVVYAFLTYYFLSFTMSQIPFDRLFILVFAGIYALLAWIRWMEARGYKYGSPEAQA